MWQGAFSAASPPQVSLLKPLRNEALAGGAQTVRRLWKKSVWGVNAAGTGFNILRGVRRPDGSDEAVT